MTWTATQTSEMERRPGGRFACRESEGEPYIVVRVPPVTFEPPVALRSAASAFPAARKAHAPPPSDPVERALLQADRVALSLRGARERTGVPLARAAAALVAEKTWCEFGFARLDDYARERLGRSGRWVRDLAVLGGRLRTDPVLASAITGADGGRPVGRVAALLIARAASPSTMDDWIAAARALSIRALRDRVRAARAIGDTDAARGAGVTETAAGDAVASDTAAADAAARDAAAADDVADLLLVRITVPSPVLAAFDEAVDLFRASEGCEATVTSFVESLVAESGPHEEDAFTGAPTDGLRGQASGSPALAEIPDLAGEPAPRDADMRVLSSGPVVAAIERALATSTGNWSHLPGHLEGSWALSLAGIALARFEALAEEAGRGGPADLDRQMRALVDLENELEARLGGVLADLADRRAWARLRFAGVGHYGEERLGLSRTTAEDRARLARDLRRHPLLREAYDAGRIGREATALIVRLLKEAPEPGVAAACGSGREAAWLARACESTIKRIRDEARALGRYRALGPRAPRNEGAPLTTGAALTAGAPLGDEAWHASLRREPGLARARVHLAGCLTLSSPDVFQAVPHEPDAFLRLRLPLDLGRLFLATVDARRRRLAAAAAALPWDAEAAVRGAVVARDTEAEPTDPGEPASCNAREPASSGARESAPRDVRESAPSWLAARTFSTRGRSVPAWVGLLALLEDFVDTWDDPRAMPRRPGDEIYVRDGWRCAAPGCTSRRHLEDHHVRYRSRGGDDDLANRTCLCRFHHQRGEHGGLASCRGRAPTRLVWRLGRRDLATWFRNERRIAPGPGTGTALRVDGVG